MRNLFHKLQTTLSEFKHYDMLFGSIVLLILFSYCYLYAYSIANNISFHPLNGDFQNYNILRRLEDGQFFASDFNSYIGMGSMLFLYIFYLLDGASGLSSSIFASYFVTQITFVIALLIFLQLFKIRFFISTLIVFIFYFYAMNSSYDPNSLNLKSIILPENSIYGLRMALPYLIALAFCFILPQNLTLNIKQKYLYSIIAGASLLWSNDYSIPVYFTATLLFILITAQTSSAKSKDIFLYFITSILTFFVLLSLFTGFSPLDWIKYNFIGVGGDQYWYYHGHVIFEISELPLKLFIVLEILFALFLLLKKDKNRYLIAFIIISSILAGFLTQVGGKLSDRYFLQSYLLLYLIPIGAIIHFLQFSKNGLLLKMLYPLGTIIALLYVSLSLSDKAFYIKKNGFYNEPLLDANLNNIYKPAVDIALKLKDESSHLEKDKKIFSEYSTLMDDIIGGFQPSGNDYIIHAMGGGEKRKYLSSFKELDPMFVTTIRDDFVHWALWSKRVNWYFFRELFSSNYVPKYYTHYNIVWQKDSNFKVIEPILLDCKIEKISDNEIHLIFENFVTSKDFIADVEINYDVEFKKSIYPIIGNRFLINVQDLYKSSNNKIKTRSGYRISPYLKSSNLMLEHKNSDVKNILKISTAPINRTKLNIKSCYAKIIRFYNEEKEIKKLMIFNKQNEFTAFNLSDQNWKNGISLRSNGFFISKESSIPVKVGDSLEFASGNREVLRIQGNSKYVDIFISGEKLDPVKDGYPNKIKLIKKEQK